MHTSPIYVKYWNQIKRFPGGLATGAKLAPTVSGPAAAALVSAAFSCFLLMVNQHLCSLFPEWNTIVWKLGYWIPGSKNPDPIYGEIGSYSGKETVMLIGWIVSWLMLHQFWKHREIKFSTIFFYLFTFLVAATVMNWHPLFPYLPLMPK
ncbi:hypothetical protein PN466_08235 [Roseofilum reptotaenium CS-1145]|uniref:Uncharacterized protein n=1 Tax=Roseofilum reptotaenium AO1-A TaxID=1925591 RepID=A0A1L9QLK7_9CYAN|nr:hypothetical protein [Roseofilum reptotaenium]MDB9516933.1 hypothetical protein [Roseofilum reptotaenium CS-1145]OJJ19766.1 hypothetical protein BI308_21270 [Roseofilum reptotaenium AO1-A]